MNNINKPFSTENLTPTEGFHRAINTPKAYEEVTKRFYTQILEVHIKAKVHSLDAPYMPWTINKVPAKDKANFASNPSLMNEYILVGVELNLTNFQGIQFVYSLYADDYSPELQKADHSYYGFIFQAFNDLELLHAQLSQKIIEFNRSIVDEVALSNGILNPVVITEITANGDGVNYLEHNFFIIDMYDNKINYKYIKNFSKQIKLDLSNLACYQVANVIPKNDIDKAKEFYTQILGGKVLNTVNGKLIMDLHGIYLECIGVEDFIYPDHNLIEPAHYGFNVQTVEILEAIHAELKNKIDGFNQDVIESEHLRKVKLYSISRRKINGFSHDAFFIADMFNNFIEIKCFYRA